MNTEPLNGSALGTGSSSALSYASATQMFYLLTSARGAVRKYGTGSASLALVGEIRATRTTTSSIDQVLALTSEAQLRVLVNVFAQATQNLVLLTSARAISLQYAMAAQSLTLSTEARGHIQIVGAADQALTLTGEANLRLAVRGQAEQLLQLLADARGYDLTTTPAPIERTAYVEFMRRESIVAATYSTAEV